MAQDIRGNTRRMRVVPVQSSKLEQAVRELVIEYCRENHNLPPYVIVAYNTRKKDPYIRSEKQKLVSIEEHPEPILLNIMKAFPNKSSTTLYTVENIWINLDMMGYIPMAFKKYEQEGKIIYRPYVPSGKPNNFFFTKAEVEK